MTTESRDRIVERDEITQANLQALTQQHRQGLISHTVYGNVRTWQVKAALRRYRRSETEVRVHFNPVLQNLNVRMYANGP